MRIQFRANGTNQTNEGYRGRKPAFKKLLVQITDNASDENRFWMFYKNSFTTIRHDE